MNIPKKVIFIIILAIFWINLVSASPIKPAPLNSNFPICNISDAKSWLLEQPDSKVVESYDTGKDYIEVSFIKPQHSPFFICKKTIPAFTLYKAQTLNATIKVNLEGKLNIGLITQGVGPSWFKKIGPDDINKKINLSWSLEREDSAKTLKLNWIPSDYKGAAIFFEESDKKKDLLLTIYEIYIK